MDFVSIYSLENETIVSVFKLLETSGLHAFLSCSLDIYISKLKIFYAHGSMSDDGKVLRHLNKNNLVIDEAFFATLYQLPPEGKLTSQ